MLYRPEGRGSPLFATLLFLMLLLGTGLGTLYWVGSRSRPGGRLATEKMEAERIARGGIERGKLLLTRARDWNQLLRGEPCNAPLVSGKGRVLCDGGKLLLDQKVFTKGRGLRRSSRLAYSLFLRNDDDEATQTGQRDEDGRVILLCEARGRGRSNQLTIEVVLSQRTRRIAIPRDYPQASLGATGSNAARHARAGANRRQQKPARHLGAQMQFLLRFLREAERRFARGDKTGTKRAARVIERRALELSKTGRGERLARSFTLLRARSALLVDSADPMRLRALRAACVSCHRQQGVGRVLPSR